MNKIMLFIGALLLSSASVVEGACRFQGCKDFQGDNADVVFDVVGEAINNGDFNVEDIQALSGLADDLNNKTKCENGTCSVGLRPTSYLAVTAFSASISAIRSVVEPPYISAFLSNKWISVGLSQLVTHTELGLEVKRLNVKYGLFENDFFHNVFQVPSKTELSDLYMETFDNSIRVYECRDGRNMVQQLLRSKRKKRWDGCYELLEAKDMSDLITEPKKTRFLAMLQSRQPFHPAHQVLTIEEKNQAPTRRNITPKQKALTDGSQNLVQTVEPSGRPQDPVITVESSHSQQIGTRSTVRQRPSIFKRLFRTTLWLGGAFALGEFAYEYYRTYGLDYNTDQVIEITERQLIVWTNRINLLLEQLDNADVDEMLGISQ